MEKRLIAKDRHIIHVILQSTLVRDSQGRPLHIIGQIVDISARKQTEEALQESEQRWLFALDGSGDGVWDWNVQTGKVFYSKRWKVMLGYDEHEIGETPEERSSRVHPDDWAIATEKLQQHLRGEAPVCFEHRVRCKDGSYKWVLDRGKIMREPSTRPLRVVGTHTDITYRKRSEQEIRRLNEKLEQHVLERTAALRATNVALEHEIAERQRAQQLLQHRTARIIAHQAALLELAKSDHADFNAALNRILATDAKTLAVERVSYWAFTEDRSAIICENLYKLSEDRHERELRLEACQYPRYFQAVEAQRLIAADDARSDPHTSEFTEDYLKPAGIVSMMDVPVWLRGKVVGIVCHEHTGPLRHWAIEEQDFAASIADMVSLSLEVAERKRAEMAARKRAASASSPKTSTKSGGWNRSTPESCFTSARVTKIWGALAKAAEQPNSFSNRCIGRRRIFQGPFGKPKTRPFFRNGISHRPARWIDSLDLGSQLSNSEWQRPAYRSAGVAEDITERKRLEEQIRRHSEELEEQVEQRTARLQELERQRAESEKLAAAGRIAARIAHEINNPLAGIKNSFLLIKDAVPSSHRYYDYVGRIEREIDRIARIIRQMFDLHRPERESVRRFRLDETIEDIVVLLKSSSHERGVTLESETRQASEVIVLPEGLIRQVLYNLVQNAIEASSPGGVVNISAAVAPEQIIIKVTDHGHGIPVELRPHIFEPFFTTKAGLADGGLGLGLSVSQSIIEAMKGSLDFESAAGQGTVFRITLPLGNNHAE
jgi:PAS domain S-box-containing protein